MLEIATMLKISDSVRSWFDSLLRGKAQRTAEEKQALRALYIATLETQMYFRRLERPGLSRAGRDVKELQRDIDKEESLARLWTEASLELRPINPELAERCFLKGQYWADRDAWTANDVRKTGIALKRMCKDAQALLYE